MVWLLHESLARYSNRVDLHVGQPHQPEEARVSRVVVSRNNVGGVTYVLRTR